MHLSALVLVAVLVTGASSSSHEDALRAAILKNYNPQSLPNVLTNVTVRLTVVHLNLDEESQIMMLDGWLALEWEDPRLVWDEHQYPNVNKLSFSREQVWTPDITLYNNGHAHVADHLKSILVLAFPTGKMMFVPTSTFPASCVLDMTYWPHDTHKCNVKFGSWVHSGLIVDLHPKDDVAEVEFEITTIESNGKALGRGQWEVLNSSVVRNTKFYSCCPEPYVDITVGITVKRNAPAFVWLTKIPFGILSVVTAMLYMMPPGSVSKILFGGILLVLDMQFMAFTHSIVHFTPSHTPIIVQMVSELLLATLVNMLVSCFVVRLVRDPHTEGLPGPLRKMATAISGCLLVGSYSKLVRGSKTGSYSPASMKGEEFEMVEGRGMVGDAAPAGGVDKLTAEQAEWLLMGAVLDRVLLILYIPSLIYKFIKYSAVL